MTITATRPRRTLSGKLVPAGTPRPLTWHDLVRPAAPQAPTVALVEETPDPLAHVPVAFRDLSDGDRFRFAGLPEVHGTTEPVGDVYTRRNRQGWYESLGGTKLRTGVGTSVIPV